MYNVFVYTYNIFFHYSYLLLMLQSNNGIEVKKGRGWWILKNKGRGQPRFHKNVEDNSIRKGEKPKSELKLWTFFFIISILNVNSMVLVNGKFYVASHSSSISSPHSTYSIKF